MPSNARAEGMLEAFDHLGYGAILVDRDGQVLELNDEARSHLGLSFQIVRGRLTASDRTAKERLEDLLARMSTRGERIPTSETGAVALPRPKGRPLVAYISPIPNALRETLGARAGMILLVDPDTDREPARALLQQAFALTPAETRLAVGLVQGHDLQSIAHLHGVSIGTLRVHLKSIFSKTGTRRQAQLLSLLARMSLRPR